MFNNFFDNLGFFNFTWKNKLKWFIATIIFIIPNFILHYVGEFIDFYFKYVVDNVLAWIKK